MAEIVMAQPKNILKLMRAGKLQYQWTGSMSHMDCYGFNSPVFPVNHYGLYIEKTAFDAGGEEKLAEEISGLVSDGKIVPLCNVVSVNGHIRVEGAQLDSSRDFETIDDAVNYIVDYV